MEQKKCDMCGETAYADAPITQGGPWAYLCKTHYSSRACSTPGTVLKLLVPDAPVVDLACGGALVEGNCLSSVVTIECNNCGEERRMEPDSHQYNCSGCGYHVRYSVMDLTIENEDYSDED